MARFFIDRPIFAWVLAIVIMLAGALSIRVLPIEQYPDIAPPSVSVSANYPGASAETIEESVTQVIEQAMKGIDNVVYMAGSSSQNSGGVTLTFEQGTDPNIAQVQVQNKLQQVLRSLPQVVQQQGVNVTKQTTGFLNMISFYSDDPSLKTADMSDYLATTLSDALSRVDGVGSVRGFGSQLAMRIWLDPFKLQQFKLMPSDVRSALLAQNTQVSAGQLGGLPALGTQDLNANITSQGRLQTPQQFRDIVLRVNADGSAIRLADVARVELGSDSYDFAMRTNGNDAAGLATSLAPGANALKTSDAVMARLQQLSQFFPKGMKYLVVVDNSDFVRLSIREVLISLLIATALVIAIMYLFLGNWRATLIPSIAVPVVLLGTFGVLAAFGYSINTLTLFAMVLAIGLLVDDAIVVVENVERIMHEEHLDARAATIKSMEQITGALLGIALVLAAVFVPMAFFSGATGVIYRQFSITIVSAMTLSVVVALTLTPAICASFLLPTNTQQQSGGGLLGAFNRWLGRFTLAYQGLVKRVLAAPTRGFLVYAVLVAALALLWWKLPGGFLPQEDQGSLMAQVQLPPGATQRRTLAAQEQFARIVKNEPTISMHMAITGFSFGGAGQSSGMNFMHLIDWSARSSKDSAAAVAARMARAAGNIRDANIFVIQPSTVRGLGNSTGFSLELEDLGGLGHDKLALARDQLLELAAADPALSQVRADGLGDTPEFHVEVDQRKAATLGLALADVNDTLSTALGGSYVNDFINKNRVKKVYVQSDAGYRMQPDDIGNWYVRNSAGQMVSLASISTTTWRVGPPRLERYNGAAAFGVSGQPGNGYTSGQSLASMEAILRQLPAGVGYEWSGASYEERKAGAQAPALYAISILFVFLCLAALYESWSLPFTVMMGVPLGIVGALAGTALRGLSNDVYFQISLVTTIGLSAKNAILIVEFAKKLYLEGAGVVDAVLQAVRIRLRPILMTSLAFMLGVMPLVLGTGAGAAGRNAIGTGVFGGMLTATVLSVFFVPLFFVFVQTRLAKAHRPIAAD
jgi:HAE1 family hydrophobic/amphiphilic exporter-1/multidrug efflux pump